MPQVLNWQIIQRYTQSISLNVKGTVTKKKSCLSLANKKKDVKKNYLQNYYSAATVFI